jgi:LmbE family N-acetylglucosaminyl deacetylase
MAKRKSIIVFCAHSDDQIFGPGATIIKYAKQGYDIYTYIFSYGESALAWLKPKEAIKTRVREAKEVNKYISGKKFVFYGLKENNFVEDAKKRKIKNLIIKTVAEKEPVKIFTHSPDDLHPDHRATYNIVIDALEKMDYKGDVYVFDVWNPVTMRKAHLPRLYEDVTDTFKYKIKALQKFESQKISLLTLLWSVYVRAIIHGMKIKKRFAERFFKIR